MVIIEFRDVEFGNAGAFELAKCIMDQKDDMKTNFLVLNGNNIGPEGGKAIIKAATDSRIMYLDLTGNPLFKGDNTPEYVLGSLKGSCGPYVLELSYTRLNAAVVNYLLQILGNTSIFGLYLKGCFDDINETKIANIRDLLLHNYYEKYLKQFWSPLDHLDFADNDETCNEIVMATFICQNDFRCQNGSLIRLPFYIWRDIFSFWKREHFEMPNLNLGDDLEDESDFEDFEEEDDEDVEDVEDVEDA